MIFDNEPFVFIDPPQSLPGAGFILSTIPSFYIGKVIKMKPEEGRKLVDSDKDYAFCGNYWVAIIPQGSLIQTEYFDKGCLNQMADFYLNYRIIPNAGRYKRYKL